jgi:predicted permease
MVAENLLVGLVGGALGLGVAYLGMAGLEALVHSHFGIWQEIVLDGRATGAAIGLTVVATLLFGLAPVLQVANPGVYRILVSGTRVVGGGGHRARKILLVGQVAMVTALLFSAGLLVRSYGHLEGLDPGFEPDGILTVQYSLDDARYTEAENVRRMFRESLAEIRRIPGVTGAAVSLTLPYERPLNTPFHFAFDEAGTNRITNAVYVTPGFFQVMGVPRVQGRGLEDRDREGAPLVTVANQAFVDRYLPDRPALGAPVRMGFGGDQDVTIVGVVGNVQQSAGWGDTSQPVWETPTLYLSSSQAAGGFFRGIHVWFSPSWVIRTAGSPDDLVPSVTRAFRRVDPDLPVARIARLRDIMDNAFSRQRFEAGFLIVVAIFALLLAGIGLYGIVAHEVLERRTEMGLRMALGATPGNAVWTAGASGLRLTAYGLLVGSFAAIGVSRITQHLVWGVTPGDPLTLAVLLGILALFAGAASFVPAARVGRMDPASILRES